MEAELPGWPAGAIVPRAGLGHVAARLDAGGRIVCFGASVTAQRDGYVAELARRRPGVRGVGLGGVGSLAGVFLADSWVAPLAPTLALVELTTGDLGDKTPPDLIASAVEGLVLKLRRAGAEVCLLHLFRADRPMHPAAPVIETYERVADRHAVPSLHAGWALAGWRAPAELTRDGIHTTAVGSGLTARLVLDGLSRLAQVSAPAPAQPPAEQPRLDRTAIDEVDGQVEGAHERQRFRLRYPVLRLAAGSSVTWTPRGRLYGALVVVDAQAGVVELEAEGARERVSLFDAWCHHARLSVVPFSLRPPAGTRCRLTMTALPIDRSVCRVPIAPDTPQSLKVIGFLVGL